MLYSFAMLFGVLAFQQPNNPPEEKPSRVEKSDPYQRSLSSRGAAERAREEQLPPNDPELVRDPKMWFEKQTAWKKPELLLLGESIRSPTGRAEITLYSGAVKVTLTERSQKPVQQNLGCFPPPGPDFQIQTEREYGLVQIYWVEGDRVAVMYDQGLAEEHFTVIDLVKGTSIRRVSSPLTL